MKILPTRELLLGLENNNKKQPDFSGCFFAVLIDKTATLVVWIEGFEPPIAII